MGGDGTLQLLVRETLGCEVTLGVIPAGGGNDYAAALGIENWREAVPAIANGKSRAVDLARVRFHNGTSAIYLGGGGVGLDAEAAKLASEMFAEWPGRLRYLAAVIGALCGFAGVEVELKVEGDETPAAKGKFLLAAALNTPSYGGGLRLAPQARIDDGLLDVVVVEKLTAFQVMSLLPRLALRGKLETARLRRYRGAKFAIHAQYGTLFHGDGEILGPDPCEIDVLKGALQVLVP
jgi:diacylglycerol kinase (ATP)